MGSFSLSCSIYRCRYLLSLDSAFFINMVMSRDIAATCFRFLPSSVFFLGIGSTAMMTQIIKISYITS